MDILFLALSLALVFLLSETHMNLTTLCAVAELEKISGVGQQNIL